MKCVLTCFLKPHKPANTLSRSSSVIRLRGGGTPTHVEWHLWISSLNHFLMMYKIGYLIESGFDPFSLSREYIQHPQLQSQSFRSSPAVSSGSPLDDGLPGSHSFIILHKHRCHHLTTSTRDQCCGCDLHLPTTMKLATLLAPSLQSPPSSIA